MLHGKGGRIRFDLPPEPLLRQWIRKFMTGRVLRIASNVPPLRFKVFLEP